ncbi:uncharacterized protein LOC108917483 isoform X3 [Anoplophora glabripennis]|uniref:uncharacterized protein LOC108917483 isoform X3 n=1 Tax=Anoplophora glabripennis TaxID=217634 RepID=UPI0008745A09|nr:uncharacterized protein LOC108917483 isoform X3 [Anoplophora glabripennis]
MKFIYIALLLTVMIAYSSAAVSCKGPNEIHWRCKPCGENCGDRKDIICAATCKGPEGCYCKPRYQRKNGICVPQSEC